MRPFPLCHVDCLLFINRFTVCRFSTPSIFWTRTIRKPSGTVNLSSLGRSQSERLTFLKLPIPRSKTFSCSHPRWKGSPTDTLHGQYTFLRWTSFVGEVNLRASNVLYQSSTLRQWYEAQLSVWSPCRNWRGVYQDSSDLFMTLFSIFNRLNRARIPQYPLDWAKEARSLS